jgi:hypothetical protein
MVAGDAYIDSGCQLGVDESVEIENDLFAWGNDTLVVEGVGRSDPALLLCDLCGDRSRIGHRDAYLAVPMVGGREGDPLAPGPHQVADDRHGRTLDLPG